MPKTPTIKRDRTPSANRRKSQTEMIFFEILLHRSFDGKATALHPKKIPPTNHGRWNFRWTVYEWMRERKWRHG